MDNRRKIKIGSGRTIYTRKPTIMESQKADWEYSKVFNQAVEAGIPPRQLVQKRLMSQGIWTVEDEQEIVDTRVELNRIVTEAQEILAEREGKDLEDGVEDKVLNALADKGEVLRAKLFEAQQKLNSLLSHTAETKAEDAKIYMLTSIVTENKDGSKIWKNYAAFNDETDVDLVNNAVMQLVLQNAGVPQEPEVEQADDEPKDK